MYPSASTAIETSYPVKTLTAIEIGDNDFRHKGWAQSDQHITISAIGT